MQLRLSYCDIGSHLRIIRVRKIDMQIFFFFVGAQGPFTEPRRTGSMKTGARYEPGSKKYRIEAPVLLHQ